MDGQDTGKVGDGKRVGPHDGASPDQNQRIHCGFHAETRRNLGKSGGSGGTWRTIRGKKHLKARIRCRQDVGLLIDRPTNPCIVVTVPALSGWPRASAGRAACRGLRGLAGGLAG
jgi:hypothetical protein